MNGKFLLANGYKFSLNRRSYLKNIMSLEIEVGRPFVFLFSSLRNSRQLIWIELATNWAAGDLLIFEKKVITIENQWSVKYLLDMGFKPQSSRIYFLDKDNISISYSYSTDLFKCVNKEETEFFASNFLEVTEWLKHQQNIRM